MRERVHRAVVEERQRRETSLLDARRVNLVMDNWFLRQAGATSRPPFHHDISYFDFDGTIIASHSVKDMFIERIKSGEVKGQEIFDLGAMIPRYLLKQDSFKDALAASINVVAVNRRRRHIR